MFKPAVKYEAKARVALIGPAGSGKSMSGLILARLLAGPDGKIAVVDTERGSISKYAGEPYPNDPMKWFEFDVEELTSFTAENFLKNLKAAEDAGYQVFMCDGLSQFWEGKDGALEFVDMANRRQKDQMGGWKDWRPHERAMVDAMIASPLHIVTTMRVKTEYQEQVDSQTGKKKRVKVGLAPIQRQGLEYEFDLVGYMDDENTFITDKTRCPFYSKKAILAPKEKDFQPFVDWLRGATPPPRPAPAPAPEAPKAAPAKPQSKTGIFKISAVTSHDDPNKAGEIIFQVCIVDAERGAVIAKTRKAELAQMAQKAMETGADARVTYDVYSNMLVLTALAIVAIPDPTLAPTAPAADAGVPA